MNSFKATLKIYPLRLQPRQYSNSLLFPLEICKQQKNELSTSLNLCYESIAQLVQPDISINFPLLGVLLTWESGNGDPMPIGDSAGTFIGTFNSPASETHSCISANFRTSLYSHPQFIQAQNAKPPFISHFCLCHILACCLFVCLYYSKIYTFSCQFNH